MIINNLPRSFLYWVFLALGILYFSYHFIEGNRGVRALVETYDMLDKAKEQKTQLQAEKMSMERKVKGLHTDSLSLDLLEEESKKNIVFQRPGEVVLYDIEEKNAMAPAEN